ncbi:MAG: LysR family transcriptional regulator [Alphaproteobacteria bacterium]|nr:LysR family transcriptional regulator [Alphaproteobacteria bacterium]
MAKLEDMKLFMRIVEKQSFSAGGREMRLSPAVVSSRMARFEKQLNTRLFIRTTRQVRVTPAGRRYYDDCQEILHKVATAESRLEDEDNEVTGMIRLSASTSFGRTYLKNFIAEYSQTHPNIAIHLQITDQLVDLVAEDIDLAFRIAPLQDSSFKTRIFHPVKRYICATPDYFKQHGTPKTPRDLEHHNCLLMRFPGSRLFKWPFQNKEGDYGIAVSGNLESNRGDILLDWALEGRGLVLKTHNEIKHLVKAGKLQTVLGNELQQNSYLHAIYPYNTHLPARVRLFLDTIAKQLTENQNWL